MGARPLPARSEMGPAAGTGITFRIRAPAFPSVSFARLPIGRWSLTAGSIHLPIAFHALFRRGAMPA